MTQSSPDKTRGIANRTAAPYGPAARVALRLRAASNPGLGVGASVAAHIALVLIILLAIRFGPQPERCSNSFRTPQSKILSGSPVDGPGGGGGGGGNQMPEPPRKAEVPGKEKITVPVQANAQTDAGTAQGRAPTRAAADPGADDGGALSWTLPGAIKPNAPVSESQGTGKEGGAGTGTGQGIGSGQGAGLGPGFGGGTGGGAYRPGAGITLPTVLREVKPAYTADAMRAKVQGSVWLECIVMPDGSVGEVKVTRSLDPIFGLDQEAIKAAKMWRFRPGMRQGEPVPVIITIELTFTLR